MDGREIALGTLHRQDVPLPCFTPCFLTGSSYYTRATGRDYWSDPEGVFVELVKRVGANLIIQWYYPGEGQRRLECGEMMHAPRPWEAAGFHSPEDVLRAIDALPPDEAVERDYDVEAAADAYAAELKAHQDLFGGHALVIQHFGMADFMGYTTWGYENYLAAAALDPAAMRRYYHFTALHGRLYNHALCRAVEKHALPPFAYGGQDICGSRGPLMSPKMLSEIYFPELKWSMAPLVEAGIGVIWHCDGNIMPILDDLMDLGVVGLQGFEEEHGVDYAEMVELQDRQDRPIIVLGCVSVTRTLPFGTPADVRASVERSFVLAGRGRGHVLCSSSSILPETPHQNIDALFEHTRQFGREFLGG